MTCGMNLIQLWLKSKPRRNPTWKFRRATSKMRHLRARLSANWPDRVICAIAKEEFSAPMTLSPQTRTRALKRTTTLSIVIETTKKDLSVVLKSSQRIRWLSKAKMIETSKGQGTLIAKDSEWAVAALHPDTLRSEFKLNLGTARISRTS